MQMLGIALMRAETPDACVCYTSIQNRAACMQAAFPHRTHLLIKVMHVSAVCLS